MTRSHLSDELAQAYVDDALSEREAERCCEHTACCPECCLLVESYRALSADLDALPCLEPELDFTQSVMAIVDEKEAAVARERRFALGIVGLAAFAAAALFLSVGASAWAPLFSAFSDFLNSSIRAVQLGVDVAGPIASALRVQILIACVVLSLPLLLAIRQLVPSEARLQS
ncbi:MAG TPA: anti-sigma factor [Anaeromyxobacteraceae bacterium]|nr:anti-sigma factor [Anaeromyxobacteraceae bacterium]